MVSVRKNLLCFVIKNNKHHFHIKTFRICKLLPVQKQSKRIDWNKNSGSLTHEHRAQTYPDNGGRILLGITQCFPYLGVGRGSESSVTAAQAWSVPSRAVPLGLVGFSLNKLPLPPATPVTSLWKINSQLREPAGV